MPNNHLLSFYCHIAVAQLFAGYGIVYLLSPEFMSYHEHLLGMGWTALSGPLQGLILSLMKAIAAGVIAFSVLTTCVLWTAYREQKPWALWVVPLTSFFVASVALYIMLFVGNYDLQTYYIWAGPVLCICLTAVGTLLSIVDNEAKEVLTEQDLDEFAAFVEKQIKST